MLVMIPSVLDVGLLKSQRKTAKAVQKDLKEASFLFRIFFLKKENEYTPILWSLHSMVFLPHTIMGTG